MAHKEKIYSALISLGEDGVYYPVSHSGRTMTVGGSSISPKTVLAYEESSDFDNAIRHRRSRKQERTNWRWILFLEFNREVTFEQFEEDFCNSPLLIERTSNSRQITFNLVDARYEHPVRNQPAKGSIALFTFDVTLSPV